jgi:cytochrome b involved in lipid metabolism
MLKKYVGVTILITWAFFTAVLVAGLVFYQNNRPSNRVIGNPSFTNPSATNPSATNPGATNPGATNPSATNPSATNPSATNPSATNGPPITLTTQEIAKHNNRSSCWLIINQQVYDVTTYLNQHPGNAGTILPYCGQEATAAFNDKGRPGGSTHSAYANSLLQDYLLGAVGQTISQSNTVPPRTRIGGN